MVPFNIERKSPKRGYEMYEGLRVYEVRADAGITVGIKNKLSGFLRGPILADS